ncbi:MAG: c-type cytochrome [Myxococcota bacterium]
MRFFTVFFVLLSAQALAADAARGFVLFHDRCASCHTAAPRAKERPAGKAPDLARRLATREGEALNRWILDPKSRGRETPCDTSALVKDPEGLADLWAYVQSQVGDPPPPRELRRKAALDDARPWQWKSRKRGER